MLGAYKNSNAADFVLYASVNVSAQSTIEHSNNRTKLSLRDKLRTKY